MRVVDVLQEKRFAIFCGESAKGKRQHVPQSFPAKSFPGDFTPLDPIFCNRSGWGERLLFEAGLRIQKYFCAHTD